MTVLLAEVTEKFLKEPRLRKPSLVPCHKNELHASLGNLYCMYNRQWWIFGPTETTGPFLLTSRYLLLILQTDWAALLIFLSIKYLQTCKTINYVNTTIFQSHNSSSTMFPAILSTNNCTQVKHYFGNATYSDFSSLMTTIDER